jgi:mannose-1-phosphate guanylyltransferase
VQYACLGGSETLLNRALRRAASIAPTAQVLVTALEEYRDRWEPVLQCVRPENRFISDKGSNPHITLAAAILSIAKASPSSVVTILPARCYVTHEWILQQALSQAACELPNVPEGVATLGMLDIDEGVDEDYMMVNRAGAGRGLAVRGIARRPTAWVSRHLRRQGAVVSSGILIGRASVFSAHISKHWPSISRCLTTLATLAGSAQVECAIPTSLQFRVPGSVLKLLRWQPPAFPQRVFTVCDSGWSGLKSPHAVARIAEIVASRIGQHESPRFRPTAPHHGESIAL